MSYLWLREGLKWPELACLLFAFVGVYLLVAEPNNQEATEEEGVEKYSRTKEFLWPLLLLILTPFLQALGNIQQRQLKDLSEITTNVYIPIVLALVYGLYMFIGNEQWTFYLTFNFFDYLLVILAAFMVMAGLLAKATALKI